MQKLCELEDVTMLYGEHVALNRVNLDIRRGEIVGLLGANGAGKTTLMEIIEGLKAPSSGRAEVLGREPNRLSPQERGDIGFMFQRYALPTYIQVGDLFRLYESLYPQESSRELIAALGLARIAGKRIGQLSVGQQQRVALLCAVFGRRSLIVLDEPTSALDVRSRNAMRDVLFERKRTHQLGILLSTHQMDEAAVLCDRIYILDRGEVKLTATSDQLLELQKDRLRFEITIPPECAEAVLARLRDGGEKVLEALPKGRWAIECESAEGPELLRAIVNAQAEHGFRAGVHVNSGRLEDVYLSMVSHDD